MFEKWSKKGIWTIPGRLSPYKLYSLNRGGISQSPSCWFCPMFHKDSPHWEQGVKQLMSPSSSNCREGTASLFPMGPSQNHTVVLFSFHVKCTQSPCSGSRVWTIYQSLFKKNCFHFCFPHSSYYSMKHGPFFIEGNQYFPPTLPSLRSCK